MRRCIPCSLSHPCPILTLRVLSGIMLSMESRSAAKGRIDVDRRLCKGCGVCIPACKSDVIQISGPELVNEFGLRYLVAAHPEKCTGCGRCGLMCPDCAITVWRQAKGA